MALPGVKTIIKDRFYSVSRSDSPVGPRVVVLAKRNTQSGHENVADLDVVPVTNEGDIVAAFGVDSHCHRAFVELVAGGAERIHIVPLPSDTTWNNATGSVTSTSFGGSVFDAAFAAAESALPDIIVPWGRGASPYEWGATPSSPDFGFFADNTSTAASSWVYKVASAVKSINENSHPCFAVMGVKPYTGTNNVMTPAQVATHLGLSNLPNRNSDETLGQLGRHVMVVATEIKPSVPSHSESWGWSNGACATAAAMSRMASYISTINKTVYSVSALRYNATKTVLTALSDKGVNSITLNFNKAPIFSDGVTFANSSSDYVRLTTVRIVNEATLLVRQACMKFIGQPSTIQIRNSMDTAIGSALSGMIKLGAILDSDFNIKYIANESKALVDLVLTPAFELRNIEVQIAVDLG